jgi:hypothetical protein
MTNPCSFLRPLTLLILCACLLAVSQPVSAASSKSKKNTPKESDSTVKAYKAPTAATVGVNFNPFPSIAESLTSPSLRLFVWPADNPALVSHYRGGTERRVIARCALGELTEQELYLYLILNRDAQPDLFQKYQQATAGKERDALRLKLEGSIRDWATDLAFSVRPLPARSSDEVALDRLRLRVALYPVYKMLWSDRNVKPTVVVAQEDINKYYQDNLSRFLPPLTAHVQMIFLRAGSGELERGAVREQLDRIYNDILAGDVSKNLTFEDAARRWSQAPNAAQGGDVPEFTTGTLQSAALENAAFETPVGQFKMFETADGFYLIKGLPTKPRLVRPLAEVSPQIHDELFMKFLRHLYVEQTRELPGKIDPIALIQIANLFEPHPSPLRLGNFSLTEDSILELFPSLVQSNFKVDFTHMNQALAGLLMGEHIARDCEARSFDADPVMPSAVRLVKMMQVSRENIRRQLTPSLLLTREQVLEYLDEHAENFSHEFTPQLSAVQVRLQNSNEIGEANRAEKMAALRDQLLRARAAFTTVTLEQTVASLPPTQGNPFALVAAEVRRALLSSDAAQTIRVDMWEESQPLSLLAADVAPKVKQLHDGLASGTLEVPRFPDLIETPNTLVMPVVEKPDYNMSHVAAMKIYELRRKVTAALEIEKRAELEERTAKEQRLEILLP